MNKDTIVAIATGNTKGAISILRISGEDTFSIVNSIVDKDISLAKGYSIEHALIKDEDEIIDEVLLSIFRAPKSYTGEDIIEINCHGGLYVTRKVLSLILSKGARLARNGEFTERAYLNDKLDLAEAEAINDLINANNEMNAKSAIHSLKGSTKRILEPLLDNLTEIIANIEVNIDYPEYDDVEVLTNEKILPAVDKWIEDINKLIEDAKTSTAIREGIDTVILGKPNVGKSSLLNSLLQEDKAIVTDIAGTTRDLVEGVVNVRGVPLNLIDTAGIHDSDDVVEKIGIERSLLALEKAELAIVVLDASKELDEEDKLILDKTANKERIIVYNKGDLESIHEGIIISCKNNDIDALKDEIENKYNEALLLGNSDTLNNERQIGLAMQALNAMQDAKKSLEEGYELDLVTIDLNRCWNSLKEITGEVHKEDLLDEIFSRFCLGK